MEKRIEALKKKIENLKKQRVDDITKDFMWRCTVQNCVVDSKIDKLEEELYRIKSLDTLRRKYGE